MRIKWVLLAVAVVVATVVVTLCIRGRRRAGPAGFPKPTVMRAEAHGYRAVLKTRDVVATEDDCATPPWGADCAFSRRWRMVASLRIWRGREEVDVPRSAFADLCDVNTLAIGRSSRGCTVNLTGSDAGNSWDALIDVTGTRVVERTVSSGEFPENHYESTEYVSKFPPEM